MRRGRSDRRCTNAAARFRRDRARRRRRGGRTCGAAFPGPSHRPATTARRCRPDLEQLAIQPEDLDAVILPVGHEDAVIGDPDAMRDVELTGTTTELAPRLD